jgi:hypothetical protein
MMQQAQLIPTSHGQALTAQLLAANARPAMGPINTVRAPQVASQGVNLMQEVQNDRAFNRELYRQKDSQDAARSLQEDQQQASIALEAQRNANALNRQELADKSALSRQELSDKSALSRIELSDKNAVAREKVRYENNRLVQALVKSDNRELQKIGIDARREDLDRKEKFQIEREDKQKEWAERENDRNYQRDKDEWERRWEKEMADLDRREESAQKQWENNLETRIKSEDAQWQRRYNTQKEDDKIERDRDIGDTEEIADAYLQSIEDHRNWEGGDNLRYKSDAKNNAIYRMYGDKEVYDSNGEVIKNPTREQFLALVELSKQEDAAAETEAEALFREKDRLIQSRYNEYIRNGRDLPGGVTRGNALNVRTQNPRVSPTRLVPPSELGMGYLDSQQPYNDGEGTDDEVDAEINKLKGELNL